MRDGGLERCKLALDTESVRLRADTDVHKRDGVGCHDVGPDAAVDWPDVDGDAACRIVEREETLDLPRELEDGADAVLGLGARVGGPAAHDDAEASDALARGLQPSFASGRRLEQEGPVGTSREQP